MGYTNVNGLYLLIIVCVTLATSFFAKYFSAKIFMSISKNLHNKVIKSLIGANITFFEKNTQGMIINRFVTDVKTLDNFLFSFLEMIDYAVKCITALVLLIYIYPIICLAVIPSVIYIFMLREKNLACRDTMRLKFSLITPMNSLIQDAVNGLTTLRCMD